MEVGIIENVQSAGLAIVEDEASQTIEYAEVFTYTHENGLAISATVEEMGRCAVLGSLAPEARAEIARAYIEGRKLQAEEQTEETEAEEEIENKQGKTEQEAEVKMTKENTNDAQQKVNTAKPPVPKTEQLPASGDLKQETHTAKVISNDVEQSTKNSSASIVTSTPETLKATAPEKVTAAAPSQEVQSTNGPEAYISPSISVEPQAKPQLVEPSPSPVEVNSGAVVASEEASIQIKQELQIDQSYIELDPQTETGTDDVKIEIEATQDSSEIELQHPADEQHKVIEEFVSVGTPWEQVIDDFIAPGLEAPLYDIPEPTQDSPESVIELTVSVEEIEQTVLQIAESIEQMELEETEAVHKILNEIVQKIAEAPSPVRDAENLKDAIETENVPEELKDLFIRLFNHVEIEYTPELIESCVRLALHEGISVLMAKIEQVDKKDDPSHDRGTHEVIKQLLTTIGRIKKSIRNAYQIGRSAMRLFSYGAVVLPKV